MGLGLHYRVWGMPRTLAALKAYNLRVDYYLSSRTRNAEAWAERHNLTPNQVKNTLYNNVFIEDERWWRREYDPDWEVPDFCASRWRPPH